MRKNMEGTIVALRVIILRTKLTTNGVMMIFTQRIALFANPTRIKIETAAATATAAGASLLQLVSASLDVPMTVMS